MSARREGSDRHAGSGRRTSAGRRATRPSWRRGCTRAGHRVEVLTTAAAAPEAAPYPVHWIGRSLPPGVRHAAFALRLARLARRADVVYVNSVLTRGVVGARVARAPVVVKLTDDPAYERARRFGLFAGDLDGFQRFAGGARVRALRTLRDGALRRASLVVCPSAYLREHALGWGLEPDRVVVVENATPELPELPTREEARSKLGRRRRSTRVRRSSGAGEGAGRGADRPRRARRRHAAPGR